MTAVRRTLASAGFTLGLPLLLLLGWAVATRSTTTIYFPTPARVGEAFVATWLDPEILGEQLRHIGVVAVGLALLEAVDQHGITGRRGQVPRAVKHDDQIALPARESGALVEGEAGGVALVGKGQARRDGRFAEGFVGGGQRVVGQGDAVAVREAVMRTRHDMIQLVTRLEVGVGRRNAATVGDPQRAALRVPGEIRRGAKAARDDLLVAAVEIVAEQRAKPLVGLHAGVTRRAQAEVKARVGANGQAAGPEAGRDGQIVDQDDRRIPRGIRGAIQAEHLIGGEDVERVIMDGERDREIQALGDDLRIVHEAVAVGIAHGPDRAAGGARQVERAIGVEGQPGLDRDRFGRGQMIEHDLDAHEADVVIGRGVVVAAGRIIGGLGARRARRAESAREQAQRQQQRANLPGAAVSCWETGTGECAHNGADHSPAPAIAPARAVTTKPGRGGGAALPGVEAFIRSGVESANAAQHFLDFFTKAVILALQALQRLLGAVSALIDAGFQLVGNITARFLPLLGSKKQRGDSA